MNRYIQEANQQFISAYNRYPIILDHGEGMYLYDIDGKRYLDFGSGIGVCGLGYHDPNYTRMLQGQIEKLLHTSNLFYNVPAIEAAKQFNQAANMEQVFFTNSGAEAIEGAIKIAKKYHFLKYKNKNGETVLDRAIHSQSAYPALKILEEKRFNNIDVLSFKNLYQLCIKNNYYGKYSKLTNLENIVDSLEKKDELVPSMSHLLDMIVENMEAIKQDLMRGKLSLLDQIVNSSLAEAVI